jgi:ankyrin repeat protein
MSLTRRLWLLATHHPSEASVDLCQYANLGRLAEVQELLGQGVSVNSRDDIGCTALANAVCQGEIKIVRLLLERGAKPNIRDVHGRTALGMLDEIGTMLPKETRREIEQLLTRFKGTR